MALTDYLAGVWFWAVGVGGAAVVTSLVVRRRLPGLRGSWFVLGWGVVWTAVYVGEHVVPLTLGIMSRGTVALTALVAVLAVSRVRQVDEDCADAPPRSRPEGTPIRVLAVVAAVLVTFNTLIYLLIYAGTPIAFGDAVSFHLPGIARWVQSGTLWRDDQFLPRFPTGSYPNTGDVLTLGVVLPWRAYWAVRFVDLPFLLLGGLSCYVTARELGAGRAAGVLAGCLLPTMPVVIGAAAIRALPDPVLLATLGAGVALLVRYRRTGERAELFLAAVALGLAFGTKWYGVSSVIAIFAVWAVVEGARGRKRGAVRAAWRAAGPPGIVAGLVGCIWFARNWVVYGNPVYPVGLQPAGVTIFAPGPNVLGERYARSIAFYVSDPSVLIDRVGPELADALGAPGVVTVVGALLAAGLLVVQRPEAHGTAGLVAVLVLVLAAVYVITPGTAYGPEGDPVRGVIGGNSRYGLPPFVVAAPLLAWTISRLGRWGLVAGLAGLGAAGWGISTAYEVPWTHLLAEAAVLACGGLAAVTLGSGWWTRARGVDRRKLGAAATAAAICAAAAGVTAGDVVQRRVQERGLASIDPVAAWVLRDAPRGHRIGLAGDVYADGRPLTSAMFGPRLRNAVEVIGPTPGGLLTEYRRRAPFLAAVRRRRFDLVAVGRGTQSTADRNQLRWLRASGFTDVAESDRWTLVRKRG